MNRNDYRRALIMLRSLKSGASGYVRLERRTLAGTLQFTLNSAPTGTELYAVLLYRKSGAWQAVKAAAFGAPRYGQVGLVWTFDPRNIEGRTLEQYDMTAVVELQNGICEPILCGNLNGSVDADFAQIRAAVCRLFTPVRISSVPVPPIASHRTQEPEAEPVPPINFCEETPAYDPSDETVPCPCESDDQQDDEQSSAVMDNQLPETIDSDISSTISAESKNMAAPDTTVDPPAQDIPSEPVLSTSIYSASKANDTVPDIVSVEQDIFDTPAAHSDSMKPDYTPSEPAQEVLSTSTYSVSKSSHTSVEQDFFDTPAVMPIEPDDLDMPAVMPIESDDLDTPAVMPIESDDLDTPAVMPIESDDLDTPADVPIEPDDFDTPAMMPIESDDFDTPAAAPSAHSDNSKSDCTLSSNDSLAEPTQAVLSTSTYAAEKANISVSDTTPVEQDFFDTPAAMPVEPDDLDTPADNRIHTPAHQSSIAVDDDLPQESASDSEVSSARSLTAGKQLALTDPNAVWHESIEPLRRLFFSQESVVPFESNGYVFIRAPLTETDSCLVGLYCEEGVPSRVCYAIPADYTSEPPIGLEGYVWRGSRTRGYWVICEGVPSA